MIDNLMELARILRKDTRSIRYHCYARRMPLGNNMKETEKEKEVERTRVVEVEVDNKYNFSIPSSGTYLLSEYVLPDCYFISYRGSPSDTTSPLLYHYGDIYIDIKGGKEKGNYALSKNSFDLAETEYFEKFSSILPAIKDFREAFKRQKNLVDALIKRELKNKVEAIYIHFKFPEVGHWYQIPDAVNNLDMGMTEIPDMLVSPSEIEDMYSLDKTYINCLCSGQDKSDNQAPNFDYKKRYQTFSLSKEDAPNVFYLSNIRNSCRISLSRTDMFMCVIPYSISMTAQTFIDYENNRDEWYKTDWAEKKVVLSSKGIVGLDDILFDLLLVAPVSITSFSLIFFKAGAQGPVTDVSRVEISGLERSYLALMVGRINVIRKEIEAEYNYFPNSILDSFFSILGTKSKDNHPLYKSHVLNVLPKIYRGRYISDDIINTAFLNKVQYEIRNAEDPSQLRSTYSTLYRNLLFLNKLQKEGASMSGPNFEAGKLLGRITNNLSKAMNSLEKNYAGQITRRIQTTEDAIELCNLISEKSLMHRTDKKFFFSSKDISACQHAINNLTSNTFDKKLFCQGFLFGYFEWRTETAPIVEESTTIETTVQ